MAFKLKKKQKEYRIDYWEGAENSIHSENTENKPILFSVWGSVIKNTRKEELRKEATKFVEMQSIDSRRAATKERVEDPAWAKFMAFLFAESITKWEGFIDDDDNPLDCTRDNKIAFRDDDTGSEIADWFVNKISIAAKADSIIKEVEVKN